MDQYSSLQRAQLSFEYLHTNSTTHEFLFGAIAELIDNSRDAGATELDIYAIMDDSLRGGYMLCFADNGCGMTTEECQSVIIFGRSLKKQTESNSIGMYGNGLKSGSMRIGNDMILFTKKDSVMTCLFLSRTFHEQEKIYEIIVPMPAFKGPDKTPVVENNDEKKHELELSIILQYSPFKSQKDLFSQFDKIKGSSGTIVIIYNMKLLDNGEPELDINSDPKDILLAHPEALESAGVDVDVELVDERRSLRAYVSILYADPRMKVYLQGRKVQTKRLISNLANRRMYNFASKTFKSRAENDVNKAKEEVKIAELRAKEAESKARELEKRFGNNLDSEQLRAVRKARNSAMELREQVKQRQNALVRKQNSLKDPKTLTFYYGINLENRACDGMFVYNCSRLIKMYQRIGPQQDSGMTCRGVVGVVNVPYLVLEPTHNKQDFADAKEFRALLRAMADHLMQYWDDQKMDELNLSEFWAKFGYLSAKWRDPPSQEDAFIRRRALNIKPCVQCDQCLKWRILPFQQKRIGQEVPDCWQCKDNPDPRHKRCSEPEEQLDIPCGVLKRKIKTKEQRQSELEEQIRKKQQELEEVRQVTYAMNLHENTKKPPVISQSKPNPPKSQAKKIKVLPSSSEEESTDFNSSNRSKNTLPKKPTLIPHRPPESNKLNVANNNNASGNKKRIVRRDSSSDDESVVSPKKVKVTDNGLPLTRSKRTSANPEIVDVQHNSKLNDHDKFSEIIPKNSEKILTLKSEMISDYEKSDYLDKLVDVKIQKQIMHGKVVEVNENRVKVRFDNMPDPSHDRWFNINSSDLIFSPILNGASTVAPVDIIDTNMDKIMDNFRNTIRYFLPPEWPVKKEDIFRLNKQQLADFPMEMFFDQYEQGLRGLFSNLQNDLNLTRDKLVHCRSLMKKVLLKQSKVDDAEVNDTNFDTDAHFEKWIENS